MLGGWLGGRKERKKERKEGKKGKKEERIKLQIFFQKQEKYNRSSGNIGNSNVARCSSLGKGSLCLVRND
jgi:hypothetical protein